MNTTRSSVVDALCGYGALPSQVVDLGRDDEPRVLAYLDLLRSDDPAWSPPTVIESNGQPRVHVFDGRAQDVLPHIDPWCFRIALRGDGAWTALLEPGRLRIFRAEVHGTDVRVVEAESGSEGELFLPALLTDVQGGQDELARRGFLSKLLHVSAANAARYGLSEQDALSLIGRGLFWRFLVDRGLLNGMAVDEVCGAAGSWEQCLDEKARAIETFGWLDATFNGGLLPFDAPLAGMRDEVFTEVLGNIAHGATEDGQLRLPSDWRDINFSQIPVGLLSEVYEAFAGTMDQQAARKNSIHYTPAPIADFVVRQALAQLPAAMRPRVLDPAAGAGVFLVTAFRHLVAREWHATGKRPGRDSIRRILNKQLVGFDVDDRALRLAELALYLSALELDPKPKPLNELRFDELRGKVLFHLPRSTGGSLGRVQDQFRAQFDVVVGNPPWTAVSGVSANMQAWVANSKDIVTQRLGAERARTFDLPDENPDLPFLWRAMEWARPGGRIALILGARWLFSVSERGHRARRDIFKAVKVTGVLNGAALRRTRVWPNVTAPWCVTFAENLPAGIDHTAAFHFISPVLDSSPEPRQTSIRFDWQDAQTVGVAEVLECPTTLKTRYRGNRLAVQTLAALNREGEPLGAYLKRVLKVEFRNGYQVGGSAGTQKPATAFHGLPDTKDAGDLGFVIDVEALPRFKLPTLLFARQREIYRAPLLLVRKAIPADPLRARASRSMVDLMYHESLHGLSFAEVPHADEWCRYLQLVLQSGITTFVELLVDGIYGVERETIYMESLDLLPLVPLDRLSPPLRRRMAELSRCIEGGLTEALAAEIDEFVFDTFDLLPLHRQTIRDTLNTALPSSRSKARALAAPTEDERSVFYGALRQSLQSVASASDLDVAVRQRPTQEAKPWRIFDVCISESTGNDSARAVDWQAFLETADACGASLVVHRLSPSRWMIGMLERYYLWTPTRARLLASDLLVEFGEG